MIDLLINLISEYGIVSALAIYLIYWMTKRLQNDLSEIKEILSEIKELLRK